MFLFHVFIDTEFLPDNFIKSLEDSSSVSILLKNWLTILCYFGEFFVPIKGGISNNSLKKLCLMTSMLSCSCNVGAQLFVIVFIGSGTRSRFGCNSLQ